MVFSTNQNRQFYVAKEVVTVAEASQLEAKVNALTLGQVIVMKDAEANIFMIQKGKGGITRTDLIDPSTVTYAHKTAPTEQVEKLKSYKVTVAADYLDEDGKVVTGDYILRVNFRQLYGMSDEDIYQKYADVHVPSAGMTAELFYAAMEASLKKALKYSYSKLLTVTSSADGLVITAMSQVDDWKLGTAQLTHVNYDLVCVPSIDSNDEAWGVIEAQEDVDGVGNGYMIADLEYFCMGERGDQYRMAMWPKNITTEYMVDPTKTYYILDIHYAYQGSCEDIQKSEKDIIIVSETKAVIDSIATATGLTVKTSESYA